MRPVTDALATLLASWGPDVDIKMADLYTFTLQGGEILHYSGIQTALSAPAPNTDSPLFYFALGPPIERTKITEKIGLDVGTIDVTVYAGPNDLLALGGSLSWQAALHAGLFDGATCEVWRAYFVPPSTTVTGTIERFYGRVGDVDIGRTKTKIHVNSLTDFLTVQMPRRLFMAGCNLIFGEPGVGMCSYDRVNGKNALGTSTGIGQQTITCSAGSNQNLIYTTFVPSVAGSYDNGTIICTSGQNAGYSRTIGRLDPSFNPLPAIYFLKPWVFPVVAGTDQFNLLPGCDHTLPTCTNVFKNQLRYGGFPDIPPPETAI